MYTVSSYPILLLSTVTHSTLSRVQFVQGVPVMATLHRTFRRRQTIQATVDRIGPGDAICIKNTQRTEYGAKT